MGGVQKRATAVTRRGRHTAEVCGPFGEHSRQAAAVGLPGQVDERRGIYGLAARAEVKVPLE